MKTPLKIFAICIFLIPLHAAWAGKPLALVWSGPGACRPSCLLDAARVALKAGFRVGYVNENTRDFSMFKEAKLWVQPGGVSVTAARAMGPAMQEAVREFVAAGGGYVGFCAGAFISTGKIGTTSWDGYGIVPGGTELLMQDGNDHAMLKVKTTTRGTRWMYYAGGPFLKITDEELAANQGEVIAWYPDGSIAGYRGHYGLGKVAVVGFHPEASFIWKLAKGKIDKDGSDTAFAGDMVKFATSP